MLMQMYAITTLSSFLKQPSLKGLSELPHFVGVSSSLDTGRKGYNQAITIAMTSLISTQFHFNFLRHVVQ